MKFRHPPRSVSGRKMKTKLLHPPKKRYRDEHYDDEEEDGDADEEEEDGESEDDSDEAPLANRRKP